MNTSKRMKQALAAFAILSAPSPADAQVAVGSGPEMVGTFGSPRASTQVTAGKTADDYNVSLKRRGACNGELSGPGRAYSSNVVTFSEKDPSSGTTCTVDITYAPDFTTVTVRESAACLSFHGASCSFEGSFKRAR